MKIGLCIKYFKVFLKSLKIRKIRVCLNRIESMSLLCLLPNIYVEFLSNSFNFRKNFFLMVPANQVYPFATTFKVNQSHSMINRYLHQNLVQSGEKGFEPLTCGFGDHCFTIRTILLRKKRFLVYGICTYLCLFSNKFATILDLNWCFFFICLFFQFALSREIVSLRMWF